MTEWRACDAPSARAPSTYSRDRTASVEPRTIRAYWTQLTNPSTSTTLSSPLPVAARIAMASSTPGNESWMSTRRITSASTQPPK